MTNALRIDSGKLTTADTEYANLRIVTPCRAVLSERKKERTELIKELSPTFVLSAEKSDAGNFDGLYIADIKLFEDRLDDVAELVFSLPGRLFVRTHESLEEVGYFDVKYKKTPVMLLHALGILEYTDIVGGTFLDKEELSLMVQENSGLIATPSYSLGSGAGIPPFCSYIKSGVKLSIGTLDNRFNSSGNLNFEAEVLRLVSNALMHDSGSVTDADIKRILQAEL